MTDLFGDNIEQEESWDEEEYDNLATPDMLAEPFQYHGNQQIIQQLNLLIATNRLPHALLFAGEQGIGKFTLAQALAHSLLSNQTEITFKDDAVLTRMQQGSHADYVYISADNKENAKKKNISVDQIRNIGEFLSKTPGESPLRVVLIDGAEHMNTNAANALLKNLEEPPKNTLIILVSHHPASLLPTIRSRVQMLKFSPLNMEHCASILKNFPQVTESHSKEDIELISDLADARPGLALTWLDADAATIYRDWLDVIASAKDENQQLSRVVAFATSLTADKSLIHQHMEIFSELLLLFIKRAASGQTLHDNQEKQAIATWTSQIDTKALVNHWFLIKDQFSLVQKLHLEYKNTLITILLRLLRGQSPLELSPSS